MHINDEYIDTKEFLFYKNTGYLRIRNENGERRILTIKKGFGLDPSEILEDRHEYNTAGQREIIKKAQEWFGLKSTPDFFRPEYQATLNSIGLKPILRLEMKRIKRSVFHSKIEAKGNPVEICKLRFDEYKYLSVDPKKVFYELELSNFVEEKEYLVGEFIKALEGHFNISLSPSTKSKFNFGLQFAHNH